MTISLKAAMAGLAAGVCLVPAAAAQAGNCEALRVQTDTLVRSYAATAAGLGQKLDRFNAEAEALTGVYAGQAGMIEMFQSISSGTAEGSASEVIAAEAGRIDESAMREAAGRLSAAMDAVNTHLDTLAVQKPAMEAALGILESQCMVQVDAPETGTPETAGMPETGGVQTVSAGAAPDPASAAPATPANPQAGKIPTMFANFWKHAASGRIYEGAGHTLLRNGNLAVDVDCDGFGTVREQPGKLCQGKWFDQAGTEAGDYRAVYVINSDTKLPMLHGELTTLANPGNWTPWDFYEMTEAEAEQEGLVESAP